MTGTRIDRAFDRLQKLSMKGTYGSRLQAEKEYSDAYQELVRKGIKPQISMKYRRQS